MRGPPKAEGGGARACGRRASATLRPDARTLSHAIEEPASPQKLLLTTTKQGSGVHGSLPFPLSPEYKGEGAIISTLPSAAISTNFRWPRRPAPGHSRNSG